MSGPAAFFAGYALVLLAAAGGLHVLGRVNSSPWSSRVLAGYRAACGESPEPASADWPHSELPRLHTGIALVAAVAAVVLAGAALGLSHRPGEVMFAAAVLLAAVGASWQLALRLRSCRDEPARAAAAGGHRRSATRSR